MSWIAFTLIMVGFITMILSFAWVISIMSDDTEETESISSDKINPNGYVHPEEAAKVDDRKSNIKMLYLLALGVLTILSWMVFQYATNVELSFKTSGVSKDGQLVNYSVDFAYEVWPPAIKEREDINSQIRSNIRQILDISSKLLNKDEIVFSELKSPIKFKPKYMDKNYEVKLVKLDISLEKGM